MRIYIWPDGTWCEDDEIGMFSHKSDDYITCVVPDEVDDIDAWAAKQVRA